MSLTGPSRTGVFSVALLAICAILLAALLWSLDFVQRDSKGVVAAIEALSSQQKRDAGELRTELLKLRRSVEDGLAGARVQGTSVASDAGDPRRPRARTARPKVEGTPRPIGGMLVNSRSEPSTLNRWLSNEGIIRTILNYVHDPLFNLNPKDLEPRAALALRWEVSDDKLQYRFWLREGVRFSDGTPFTAHDVAYTLGVIQDPNVQSDIFRPQFEDVVKVEVVNDHEIVFHYRQPYWRGIFALGYSLRIMSAQWVRDAVERIAAQDRAKYPAGSYELEPGGKKFGELYNEIKEPSIGTGPYRYDPAKSWVKGSHLTIYRNPSSWWFRDYVGKWNLAAMRWRWIIEDSVLWEEVKKRNVDVRVVDADKWIDSFSKDEVLLANFEKYQYDHVGIGNSIVLWNHRNPLFADVRVRNAMTHLIDRKTMLEDFDHNIGSIATCIFKRWYPEYSFDLEPKLLDIERARELLEEAGWKDSNGDGIRDKDGVDFRYELLVPQGRKEYIMWGQLWQGHMKRAGVDLILKPMEWSSFITTYYDHTFDAACLYHSHSDPWIEPYEEYLSDKTGPKQPNHAGWINKEVDELLRKARVEFDPVKRRALFHRFNKIRYDEQPATLLLHGEVIVVLDKRFKNVVVEKAGATPEDWFVPEGERLYDDDGTRLNR